jgi:hypothetical protein
MAKWIALLFVVFGCIEQARALDTSGCGFMACEAYIAAHPDTGSTHQVCVEGPYTSTAGGSCTSTQVCDYDMGQPVSYPQGRRVAAWGKCNCTSDTPIVGGQHFDGSNGHICHSGCTQIPTGPSICYPDETGLTTHKICTADGWHADGSQCDPIRPPTDGPPPDVPPPPDNCNGSSCAPPPVDVDPGPPDICMLVGGVVHCVPQPPSPCGGNPTVGYLCAGTPPPSPPPPPATAPDPNNPTQPAPPNPSIQVISCSGDGSCSTVNVNYFGGGASSGGGGGGGGGGDGGGDGGGGGTDPGGGSGGQGGEVCPDGSQPVNGQCAASQICPDGTQPVNGRCNQTTGRCTDGSFPVNGACPVGTQCSNGAPPINGVCPPTCANGSVPVGGQCPPTYVCQDGSTPVGGQCPVGHCNPVTDPNHCEGSQANGGGTCAAAPSCNGDPVGCATLYQSWSTRCEVAKLNPTELPQSSDYGTDYTAQQVWETSTDGDSIPLNNSGWLGGGGSCPQLPSAQFMSTTVDFSSIFPCDALRVLAQIILLAGYAQAAFVLGRSA